jgi:hypothetical protein
VGGGVVGGVSGSSTIGGWFGLLFAGSSSVDKFADVNESVRQPESIREVIRTKLKCKPKIKVLFLTGFN